MEPVDYIICGRYVLPMDGRRDVIEDGALAVRGKNILDVGERADILEKYSAKKSLEGGAVFPGLINTHTHAAMVLMRGIADDLPLKEWLEKHIWPVENRWLGPEFIEDAVGLACLEMLKAGVTTFCDMYFFEDVTARTVEKLGMRAVLGTGIVDFPTKTTSGAEDCLRNAEKFIGQWKGSGLVTPAIAPHSVYACGPETLKKAMDTALKHDVLCHIHLSETEWEVNEIKSKSGKRPAMYLDAIGVLNDRLLAAHCVWLSDEEIGLLAEKGVAVSHCVESNLKLASGVAPVTKMLRAGLNVTFGTDGAASNNDLNVLSEMSTAAKLHKAVSKDPTALDARTVLQMATCRAARALGLENTGSLEPGKAADVVMADLEKPHLVPLYNIYSQIVYSLRPSDMEAVMVDGRLVVQRGEFLPADEGEILRKAKEWGERVRNEKK